MATIISPDEFSALTINEMVNDHNIINPAFGIVKFGLNSIPIKGGEKFSIRFQNALSADDLQHITNNATTTSPVFKNQKKVDVVGIQEQLYIGETFFDTTITGVNTLESQFKTQYARVIVMGMQKYLIAGIKGAFSATSASPFKTSITGWGEGNITLGALMKIKAQAWEHKDKSLLKALIVHSEVYADLLGQTAIEYKTDPFGANAAITGSIPMLGGLAIIENSTIAAKFDNAGTANFHSYIVGANALQVDVQRESEIYRGRTPGKSGGESTLDASTAFYATVANASWKGASGDSPDATAYELGTNWEWIYFDPEEVLIHQITSEVL